MIKVKTKISKKGRINLENYHDLFDREVDIYIDDKSIKKKNKIKVEDFIEKWTGVLKIEDVDLAKYNFLINKAMVMDSLEFSNKF